MNFLSDFPFTVMVYILFLAELNSKILFYELLEKKPLKLLVKINDFPLKHLFALFFIVL